MKCRYFVILLLITCMIFGCQNRASEVLTEPPTGYIVCGNVKDDMTMGTYSWSYSRHGSMTGIEADSEHPLFMDLDPIEINGSDPISLNFGVTPAELSVRCWPVEYYQDEGSYDANYITLEVKDGCIEPLTDNTYIYEVTATWKTPKADEDGAGGTVYYGFATRMK